MRMTIRYRSVPAHPGVPHLLTATEIAATIGPASGVAALSVWAWDQDGAWPLALPVRPADKSFSIEIPRPARHSAFSPPRPTRGRHRAGRRRETVSDALELYRQQEQLCRELGDKVGCWKCLNEQGIIVFTQGRFDLAMGFFKEVEQIALELQDYAGLAMSLANQAEVIGLRLNQASEGLAKAHEAHRIAIEHGLKDMLPGIEDIIQKIQQHGQA